MKRVESSAASPQPTSTTLLLTIPPARLLTERTADASRIMAILTTPASHVPQRPRQTRQLDRRRHQAIARTGKQTASMIGKLVHYADPREREGLCQGPLPSVAGATPVSRLRSERGDDFLESHPISVAGCLLRLHTQYSLLLKACVPRNTVHRGSGRRSDQSANPGALT